MIKMGLLSEAEAVLKRGTQKKQGPIDEVYLNLGAVYVAQCKYALARDAFEMAVELAGGKYADAESAPNELDELKNLHREWIQN